MILAPKMLTGNSLEILVVPKTNTGGWVEYTKVYEIIVLKELGKLYV